MEPDAVLLEDVSEGVQMVDTHPSRVTNIRCASEDTVPLGLLFADDSLKRVLVHAEVLVDGHTDNVLAQREPRHSSADRIVLDDFGYQNAGRAGGNKEAPETGSWEEPLTGRYECDRVGQAAPKDQDPADLAGHRVGRSHRVPEGRTNPVHDFHLDEGRLAGGDVMVSHVLV